MQQAFPNIISKKAIILYFVALILCSILYFEYSLDMQWIVWGIVEVLMFFYLSHSKSIQYQHISSKSFVKKIFYIALILRIAYVIFSYFYYISATDTPFEYDSQDAVGYHDGAIWLKAVIKSQNYKEFFALVDEGISDVGYVTYLTFVYFIFDDSIIVARLIKAVLSSITCVLIYQLSVRNFGEKVGRVATIMCVFCPNLIYYCGVHLKETEMVFLAIFFLSRADAVMRQSNLKVSNIVMLLFVALLTFTFRTVLGVVLFCSFGVTVLFTPNKIINKTKKIVVAVVSCFFIFLVVLDNANISSEIMEVVNTGGSDQQANMEWRSQRKNGNQFAKYAGAAVFAPLIFSMPFPTMVETPNQFHQKMLNGGYFCKNIMSFFTIIALFFFLKNKTFNDHLLIISFYIGYLFVLVFSKYAQSERFHLPILSFTYIFASYGLTFFKSSKIKNLYQGWLILMLGIIIFWNWFKLAGRNMI